MSRQTPESTSASSTDFVCIQTMWRSCGTYVWNKARGHPRMCGYFEPCSEWLLQDSGDHIERSMTTERLKRLRHPVSSHYFSEFPFETGVGVAGFQKRFSFETYYMRRRQPDPELRQYIGDLVRRADCTHRRAAMKFCRFGLRSGWLRQAFSPSIVYVLREPDAMFRSYWS